MTESQALAKELLINSLGVQSMHNCIEACKGSSWQFFGNPEAWIEHNILQVPDDADPRKIIQFAQPAMCEELEDYAENMMSEFANIQM